MMIPEAVRQVMQAGTLASSGEISILDMGDPVRIIELARDLIELSGLRPRRDIQIQMTQLRPGEKLVEELVDSTTERPSSAPFEKIRVIQGQPIDPARFVVKLVAPQQAAQRGSPEDIYRTLRQLEIGFNPEGSRQVFAQNAKAETQACLKSRSTAKA